MIRNTIVIVFFTFCLITFGCSNQDVIVDPTKGLHKITEGNITTANVKVELWTENETLIAGYNKIYFTVYDLEKKNRISDADIHCIPVMNMGTMSHSTFIEDPAQASNEIFPAAVTFIMPSGDMGSWTMQVHLTNHRNNLSGEIELPINVGSVSPSQLQSFATQEGEKIFLTYNFSKGKKVGINDFQVIAFKKVMDEFIAVTDLTIVLTPEMPSMSHGSPNNVDPAHVQNGHYTGKVNFTMTGDWRLHLQIKRSESVLKETYFDVTVD